MLTAGRGEACDPPGAAGACPGGAVCLDGCRCPEPACDPVPEICDGLDNDCDGTVDEGNPGGGTSCGTSDVGACRRGTLRCVGGRLTCPERVDPTPEVCGDAVDQDCDGADPTCVIAITSPPSLSFFATSPVEVRGTVAGGRADVVCNGVPAVLAGGAFTVLVPLHEGNNVITCVAGGAGSVATASITLTLDSTPPRVTIRSPDDGAMVSTTPITATGMINDIVVGTVNGEQARVACNGVEAAVANRAFLAAGLALLPGLNTITCIGTDRAGNVGSASIGVVLETAERAGIAAISGGGQIGPVGAELPEPLVVELTDGDGNPASGRTVILKVVENNGTLSGSGLGGGRSLALTTDAAGRAEARWTLGTRAGAGNNMVEATSIGVPGVAVFAASADTAAPAKMVIDMGDHQTGTAGQPLPRPFVVVVTDAGNNRLSGVPVTFEVIRGGGNLGGLQSRVVATDGDGLAAAVLTLGPEDGIESNAVTVNFPDNPGLPITFVATGMIAGDPAATRVVGVVLDNTDEPVPGVTVRLEGTALSTRADAQGQFVLAPAPVGTVHLLVNGSTAERPGTWPGLAFEIVTVAGRDNSIGRPIYLLPIDVPNGIVVSETQGGTLTLPEVPGFSLTVAPGTATFRNGSRQGVVSVTLVHTDKVPMVPSFGQQPRFVITIQPAGVRFEPPAPIAFPNVDGLPPGTVTEFQSFDHDLGQFVAIGTGTVSNDGTVLRSDPGVGILEGGWHDCGCNPRDRSNCGKCGRCQKFVDPFFDDPHCEADPRTNGERCRSSDDSSLLVETNGVKVHIEGQCALGHCEEGICKPLADRFGYDTVEAGVREALAKIFDDATPCMGVALRTKMRMGLQDRGLSVTCFDRGDTNGDGSTDCASAPLGGNTLKISNRPASACGPVSKSIRHEMQHGAGMQPHVPGCGDSGGSCASDPVHGCDRSCFGTSTVPDSRAESCP